MIRGNFPKFATEGRTDKVIYRGASLLKTVKFKGFLNQKILLQKQQEMLFWLINGRNLRAKKKNMRYYEKVALNIYFLRL